MRMAVRHRAVYHVKMSTPNEPSINTAKETKLPHNAMITTTTIKKRICFHSITLPLISSAFPHANMRKTKRARHKRPVTRSNAMP